MDLNQLLQGLIQQVPVIGVLLWLVITQRTEIQNWQHRYMDLNQKLIEVLKDQMNTNLTELRTLAALERRRSEYDLRKYDGISNTSGERTGLDRQEQMQKMGLQSMRNEQPQDVESKSL